MNEIDYIQIGLSIRENRKRLKMTQKELSEKIGKAEITVRKYEKGLVQIPNDVLEKLSKIFNISVFDLISNDRIFLPSEKDYDILYNNVVKNQIPKEMPVWIERLILKSKIDKNFSHAVNEFITHKLISNNLNTDLKEIEVISQKTFEYLETLTNELTLKEYIKKLKNK